jgi:hypothetical protein
MAVRRSIWFVALLVAFRLAHPAEASEPFVNFESAPVHPVALSPNGQFLAVCNLPAGRLDLLDVGSGSPNISGPTNSIPVGVDPVSVRFRTATEVWVVNHISDSISVVDLSAGINRARVKATIDTLDTPSDVVFAGQPGRAFVSCARPNRIQVFEPVSRQLITNLVIEAERPKALAVSPDQSHVYAAIFESGNRTTIIGAKFKNRLFVDNVVGLSNAPSGSQNPAPNSATGFQPPLNPNLPTNQPPPGSGLIVRKSADGRWLDDHQGDWTEFVSGTNAHLTGRIAGWDLPDRDLAIIDADNFNVSYVSGAMNICMDLAVNPISGTVAMIGTDARNEARFEPNLNGTFAQVHLALIPNAPSGPMVPQIIDLNPHLTYLSPTIPAEEREQSIGEPRAIVWNADGTTAYVAGLGSRNMVILNADGTRRRTAPIELGEGPCGLALDEARHRLYIYHRFSDSVSVMDTQTDAVLSTARLFDPTPLRVAAGRRHLYDTRRTSGLGHVSCATCHVDARMDRLAWDLGNPAGELDWQTLNQQGVLVTNSFHPMKGAMLTQTLQDIIGHEPFHWRGDRPDIEAFNPTFTRLQGRPEPLSAAELSEMRDFLASIRLPPNPFRDLDNALPTHLPLPDHFASGQGPLPAGTPLPAGNALDGITAFHRTANFCNLCHTLPTGLGLSGTLTGDVFQPFPPSTNQAQHFPVSVRLEGSLPSKIAQFRNLADRLGMDATRTNARAGFGFGHDGSVDSLTRFLVGLQVVDDQEAADLIALLLSVAGSDLTSPGAVEDSTPPAGVGRQLTLSSPNRLPHFDSMLALARSATSRVDVVVKGLLDGQSRGWWFDRTLDRFQGDRASETISADDLLALARPGQELTLTIVARGTGRRLGIDQDFDGVLDQDELDAGQPIAQPDVRPEVVGDNVIPIGTRLQLSARVPPLVAPGSYRWFYQGQPLPAETNTTLLRESISPDSAGNYVFQVITPFETITSLPHSVQLVPMHLSVTPASQTVRRGSNATLNATVTGQPPSSWQWQFNDRDLPGATASALTVQNVQRGDEGYYRVIAQNSYGYGTSAPVWLGVLINPTVVIAPLNQSVVPGAAATFAFQIDGHPPPFGYQLRRSTTLLTNYVSDDPSGFLTLFNVQPNSAGSFRIVVTNAANPNPGLSLGPVTLSVLEDFDHDGLPDSWEVARGLNTNNTADAALDWDGDGLSNLQEYLAGTDLMEPTSALRIGSVQALAGGGVFLQFEAQSNRTYSVHMREAVTLAPWHSIADLITGSTNRLITVTNTSPSNAIFRLVTPKQ